MSAWYYEQNGVRQGPVELERLRALAADGTLLPTPLVWTSTLPNWTAAREVDALKDVLPADAVIPPPLGATAGATDVAKRKREAEAFYKKPRRELALLAFADGDCAGFWRRLAANVVDGWILYLPFMVIFVVVVAGATQSGGDEDSAIGFGYLVCLVAVLAYHTFFLSSG